MTASLATVAYIGATILFILSLGGLSNPETLAPRQPVRHDRHGDRRARHGVRPAGHAGRLSRWLVGAMVVGAAIGARTPRASCR